MKRRNPYPVDNIMQSNLHSFGMLMKERTFSSEQYKFGFNGKENDNEVKGEGNEMDFGARIYDSKLCRFLSRDPVGDKVAEFSCYSFALDNPIWLVDKNGLSGENPQQAFHDQFATPTMQAVKSIGATNKYKALYILAQRRAENSFNLNPPNNNPMNIMGQGDLGQAPMATTEYINGKLIYVTEQFANFSSVQKGFEGYLNLIKANDKDAYDALSDNTKTIDDFTNGLKKGGYATAPSYAETIKVLFKEEVSYYKKAIKTELDENNKALESYDMQLKSSVITQKRREELGSLKEHLISVNETLSKDLDEIKKIK